MARNEQEEPVTIGEVLAGKYKVETILGAGGMGFVVAARHVELGERVAIKLLRPEILDDRDAVARFAREARAMFRLKGEHVAKVLDVGKHSNGVPFMVLEHLAGVDLGKHLASRGRLGVEEALSYVLQACEAVAEAHALGIVHRDIKPQNLFLSRRVDGTARVKVLDFGISKMTELGEDKMRLTSTSMVMGSPFYMSPEQLRSSASADERSDVWALGVVLYELLTGKVPYTAESPSALYARILEESPEPPHAIVPEIPAELSAVVLYCLERKPEARIASVVELAQRLEPFAGESARGVGQRVAAIRAAVATGDATPDDDALARVLMAPPPTQPSGTATDTAWEGTDSSKRRARLLSALLIGGGTATLLLVALVWTLMVRSHGDAVTSTAAPSTIFASTEGNLQDASVSQAASTVEAVAPIAPLASSTASAPPNAVAAPRGARPTRVPGAPRSSAAPKASFDPYDSRTWGTGK